MVDPKPDLSDGSTDYEPYRSTASRKHVPAGAKMSSANTRRSWTRARRNGASLRQPRDAPENDREATRENQGSRRLAPAPNLLVTAPAKCSLTWVRTGARAAKRSPHPCRGVKAGHMNIRHCIRCRTGSNRPSPATKDRRDRLNDEGLYGFGQLAIMLRARYAIQTSSASRRPTASRSRSAKSSPDRAARREHALGATVGTAARAPSRATLTRCASQNSNLRFPIPMSSPPSPHLPLPPLRPVQ